MLSAKAAGIPCLVTVSGYSVEQAFDEADLVVSNLGEPDAPAKVLSGPHGITPAKEVVIDPQLLRSLVSSSSRTAYLGQPAIGRRLLPDRRMLAARDGENRVVAGPAG